MGSGNRLKTDFNDDERVRWGPEHVVYLEANKREHRENTGRRTAGSCRI